MDSGIMVVDGSALSREVIMRRVAETLPQTRVVGCGSAAEALGCMEVERFSLITSALLLPDMDGLDFCRRVRASKRHHYCPVIVISSDAEQRLRREGYAAGITDYFDKSLGFKAFGQFIKNFLERHAPLYGRVLYVEDSRTAAALTRQMLEQHGLQVVHTLSAEEALERLEAAGSDPAQAFDMVITDFHLEGAMTGGDLLYVLRARRHYSQQELPVLVITGNEDVQTQVEVFHAGANDFVIKPLVEEVAMARVRSLLLIKHQFDALKRQTEDMERLATTDSLTGTRNRRYLVEEGQRFLGAGEEAWVMIVDLDHFKRINDTQGHLVGDQVLMAMGALLNRLFPDGLVARFGGEEFVVLLHGGDVPARAERLRQEVTKMRPAGVETTISIGLAAATEHPGHLLNALLGLADQALYGAKAAGRNSVRLALCGGVIIPPGFST